MNSLIAAIFVIFFSGVLFSQGPTSQWHFGVNASIQFENFVPHATTGSAIFATYGCASISNTTGDLLYYASPTKCYNENHEITSNAAGIIGNDQSSQGAMFIPNPIDPNRMYLVTNDFREDFGLGIFPNTGHYLHELKRTFLHPTGQMIQNKKNILFSSRTGERVTAVHHANGRDVWLIVRVPRSDTILSFLLSESGIDPNPVVSETGYIDTNWSYGQIKASPNGKLIAEVLGGIFSQGENVGAIHQFNNETGMLQNTIILPSYNLAAVTRYYGTEFSANSRYAYFSKAGGAGGNESIEQYDLLVYDSSAIVSSRQSPNQIIARHSLQIGIDRKIYIGGSGVNFLARIENPIEQASSLILTDSIIDLSPGITAVGLPDFIQSYFHPAYFDYSRPCAH